MVKPDSDIDLLVEFAPDHLIGVEFSKDAHNVVRFEVETLANS